MLKGIPKNLSPELVKVLMEMGHGDKICIGDGNFAGEGFARESGCKLIRCDSSGVPELLRSILSLMPLDEYVDQPVKIMQASGMHEGLDIPIWAEYRRIVAEFDRRGDSAFEQFILRPLRLFDGIKETGCIFVYFDLLCTDFNGRLAKFRNGCQSKSFRKPQLVANLFF